MDSSSNEKPVCLIQKISCKILPTFLFSCSSNQMVSLKSSNDLIKSAPLKLLFSSAWYILCLGAFLYKLEGNVEGHFETSSVWIVGTGCISNFDFIILALFVNLSLKCFVHTMKFWLVSSQIHWQSLIHFVIKSDLLKVKENPCIFSCFILYPKFQP